jgi:hypothetical protein
MAIVLTGILLPLASLSGCDTGMDSLSLSGAFCSTTTSPVPNLIRLRVRGYRDFNILTLAVTLEGPTTSTDIYSFAFDLVLSDPSIAHYVGPATLGTALDIGSGQGSDVEVTQTGDRIVVGVTKTGGGTGNGVAGGEATIVSMVLQVLKEGTTSISFEGSPSNPIYPTADPAGLDSSGVVIESITFDPLDATVTGTRGDDVNCSVLP